VRRLTVTFLGTNGWYDTATGNTICILIDAGAFYILLDAGNGIHKFNTYARAPKPVFLFLSHFHLDHIEGLHTLAKQRFTKGLTVISRKGARDILGRILIDPFTLALSDLPYSAEILETEEGPIDCPFPVETRFLRHSTPTLGFRFALAGKTIAYCPDTGTCENALKLAERADLLIAECAYRSGEELPEWPHLNPESAARLARDARAGQLALVHFDADRYRSFSDRNRARAAARKIFPRVIAARDGLVLKL